MSPTDLNLRRHAGAARERERLIAGHGRRAVFFDLDGTLADSHGAMRRVFDGFAAACSRIASDRDFAAIQGPPVPVLVAKLKQRWGLTQRLDELVRQYEALIDGAFLAVAPMEGATATLEAAFGNGWQVGVVTSNSGPRCLAWLARTGLAPFVDLVVGGDQVCLGKPEPEPYRIALARSRCLADAAIAVEDSLQGARSALAAGLRTFGIAAPERAPVEWPDSVRLIFSLEELIPEFSRQKLRPATTAR